MDLRKAATSGRFGRWWFGARMMTAAVLLTAVVGADGRALAQGGAVEGRPVVARSSAETYASQVPDPGKADMQTVLAGLGASQLEFFDDLEKQALVCHDDALHASLLMGAGINATTFEQRTAMAVKLGWIAPAFDRPAREAITVGEACRILARMMGESATISQEQAVERVASVGGLPANLKTYQGITGAQLMSVLGAVHDAVTPKSAPTAPGTAPNATTEQPAGFERAPVAMPGAVTEQRTSESVTISEPGQAEPVVKDVAQTSAPNPAPAATPTPNASAPPAEATPSQTETSTTSTAQPTPAPSAPGAAPASPSAAPAAPAPAKAPAQFVPGRPVRKPGAR